MPPLRRTIRALLPTALLAGGALFAAPADEGRDVESAVMAVVNREIITRKDVLDRAAPALSAIAEQRLPPADIARYQEAILQDVRRQMVEERLLSEEGRRMANANEAFKKRVDERVLIRIEDESRKIGGEALLRERVKALGETWQQYVDRLTSELMREVVIYQFVTRDLTVGPEEIREQYERRRALFTTPERVRFRQVFLRFGKPEERRDAYERALAALEEARKGGDFAAVARRYSDDPRDAGEGLWETARGARPAPVDEKLFTAPLGVPTEPVETERGFYILRVEARFPAETRPLEEVQARIEAALLAEKRQARYSALIERLAAQSYVEFIR